MAENSEKVNMRKFAREYMEKYLSIKKVYTAIAGNRRRGSETTAETTSTTSRFSSSILAMKIRKLHF
jgi:hypothetical protein